MASKLNYVDYVKLHYDDNIRQRFSNLQWVAFNKLVRQESLSVEEKRALFQVDVIDRHGEITLSGRVCTVKINKKRQQNKDKDKIIRKKLAWETEND